VVRRVLSTDAIGTTKPHPSVYAMTRGFVRGEAWMVAAHGWDLAALARALLEAAARPQA
jgi:hypothetical protein